MKGYEIAEKYAQPQQRGVHEGIGYGKSVRGIFNQLKDGLPHGRDFDLYGPACNQFGGSGSFGNGGAMRTHPVALFAYGRPDDMIMLAEKQAKITHGNEKGYIGAALQVGER